MAPYNFYAFPCDNKSVLTPVIGNDASRRQPFIADRSIRVCCSDLKLPRTNSNLTNIGENYNDLQKMQHIHQYQFPTDLGRNFCRCCLARISNIKRQKLQNWPNFQEFQPLISNFFRGLQPGTPLPYLQLSVSERGVQVRTGQ